MRKLLLFVLLAFTTTFAFTQNIKKEFTISDFNGIDASGVFKIELIKSNDHGVTVEASQEMMQFVIVKVVRGKLVLGLEPDIPRKLRNNQKPIIATVRMNALNSLEMSGVVSLHTTSSFTPDRFFAELSGVTSVEGLSIDSKEAGIVLSGASSISLEGKIMDAKYELSGACKAFLGHTSEKLLMEASGASNIELSGNIQFVGLSFSGAVNCGFNGSGCKELKLEMSGASNFKSLDNPINEASVKLSGVSNASVYVTGSLTAEASGGSNIKYKGNPEIKSLDISSISTFKKIN